DSAWPAVNDRSYLDLESTQTPRAVKHHLPGQRFHHQTPCDSSVVLDVGHRHPCTEDHHGLASRYELALSRMLEKGSLCPDNPQAHRRQSPGWAEGACPRRTHYSAWIGG